MKNTKTLKNKYKRGGRGLASQWETHCNVLLESCDLCVLLSLVSLALFDLLNI